MEGNATPQKKKTSYISEKQDANPVLFSEKRKENGKMGTKKRRKEDAHLEKLCVFS